MGNSRDDGKHLLDPFFCVPVFLIQASVNLRLQPEKGG
jgi:hypothetical protein